MAGRFKPKPRLNVQSDNLVYLWNMPVGFRGRDLKRKVDAQFGPVRFIETFEAWTSRPIGRVVIEFATYSAAEDFTEAMAAERVPYLQPPVQFQDLISIGKRQFFELVYRDTDVDLLACDGHPPSAEWSRERSRGGARSVLSSSSSRNNNSYQPYSREGRSRRRSPSPDLGPFPATSNSSRIRRFLWNAQSGRCHILTVEEPAAVVLQRQVVKQEEEGEIVLSSDDEEGEVDDDEDESPSPNNTNSSGSGGGGAVRRRCRSRSRTPSVGPFGFCPPTKRFLPPHLRHPQAPPPVVARGRSRSRGFVEIMDPVITVHHQNRGRSRTPVGFPNFANFGRRSRSREHCVARQPSAVLRDRSRSRGFVENTAEPNPVQQQQKRGHSHSPIPDGSFGSRRPPRFQERCVARQPSAVLRDRSRSRGFVENITAEPNPVQQQKRGHSHSPIPDGSFGSCLPRRRGFPPPSRHQQHQQQLGVVGRRNSRSRSHSRGGFPPIAAEPSPSSPQSPPCRPRCQTATAALRTRLCALFGPPPFTASGANAIPMARSRPIAYGAKLRRHTFNNGCQQQQHQPPQHGLKRSFGTNLWGHHQQQQRPNTRGSDGPSKRWCAKGNGEGRVEPEVITIEDDDEEDGIGAVGGGGAKFSVGNKSKSNNNSSVTALSKAMMDVRFPPAEEEAEEGEIVEMAEGEEGEVAETAATNTSRMEVEEEEEEEELVWDEFELLEGGSAAPVTTPQPEATSTPVNNPQEKSIDESDDVAEEGEVTVEDDDDDDEEEREQEKEKERDEEAEEMARLLDGCGDEEADVSLAAATAVDERILLDSTFEEEEEEDREEQRETAGDTTQQKSVEDSNKKGVERQGEEIVKSIRMMSLANTEQAENGEQQQEEEEMEQRVLELTNLKRGFSLDRIRETLQTVGDVPCAVQTSPTGARFHCACGAQRAARFLAEELGEQYRVELLGPGVEFAG